MVKRHGDGKLRLAIVGCGGAAEHCHLAGLPHVPEVELVALVDPVEANARRLAELYAASGGDGSGVRIAPDVAAVAGEIDAAVIASPHRTHAALAIELAGAGVDCLVEKPMAITVGECDRMAAAASENGTVLGVAHVRRLFPASPWVRQIVADGSLGTIRKVRWREGAPYDWPLVSPSLFMRDVSGGGVLADSGPHVLDLLLWWFQTDHAELVACRDTSLGGAESEATLELLIRGAEVRVDFSRLRSFENTCRIEGSEASVEFGIDVVAPFTKWNAAGTVEQRGIVPAVAPAEEQWELLFAEQLRNFAAAARGKEALYADAAAGRHVVGLIESCYGSRESVELPWRELEAL